MKEIINCKKKCGNITEKVLIAHCPECPVSIKQEVFVISQ